MKKSNNLKRSFSIFIVMIMVVTNVFVFNCFVTPQVAFAAEDDITAAAWGDVIVYNNNGNGNSQGDTYYNTWGAGQEFFIMHDDGNGFFNGGGSVNNRLCRIDGNPNVTPNGILGYNLNPGSLGSTMPQRYSCGLGAIDGILYIFKHSQNGGPLPYYQSSSFFNTSIYKSTDGGANWYNSQGVKNGLSPDTIGDSTFTSDKWGFPNFINYGMDGAAPDIDNAREYVYLCTHDNSASAGAGPTNLRPGLFGDHIYLARIKRSLLPDLNRSDFQYYKGVNNADGMLDSNWSSNINDSTPILSNPAALHGPTINYNYGFGKYVMSVNAAYFPNAASNSYNNQQYRIDFYTSDHPWGPWTKLLSQGIPGVLAGLMANNKWSSPDGGTMWFMSTGGFDGTLYPYSLLYTPVYFSKGAVDTYQAENVTRLGGTTTASSYGGYTGAGYVTGFTNAGDGIQFTAANINGTGKHIIKFRYATSNSNGNSISVYVNGSKVKAFSGSNRLSYSDNNYRSNYDWTENSFIYDLQNGSNTIQIKLDSGDAGTGLKIDSISISREKIGGGTAPRDNLAFGKPVTASTVHAQYPKAQAADGDLNTIWAGNSGSYPQWIYVDLGSSQALGSTKWTSGNTDNSNHKYKIEGSNDASSWTLLADRTGAGATTSGYITDNISGSYRYVRLTITSINNSHWGAVGELEVYAPYTSPGLPASPPRGTNLAFNKTVSASSAQASYPASNSTDRNLNNYWAATSSSFPQWIYVDLGEQKSIQNTRWMPNNMDNSTNKYKIEGSNDTTNWTLLADHTGTGVTTSGYMADSVTGSYRYVRLTITGISNGHWASAAEFEVYDGALPPPSPGGFNYAYNKPVTVSTEHGSYPKAGAVDNSLSTIWAGNSGSYPQWIYVDLGWAQNLGSVRWTSGNNDNSNHKYKIEGSSDASNWTLLADRTGAGVTTSGYMTDIVNGSYRYVRLTITNINNSHWGSVGTLEVYN